MAGGDLVQPSPGQDIPAGGRARGVGTGERCRWSNGIESDQRSREEPTRMAEEQRRTGGEVEPLATENAAIPQDKDISEFGDVRAKERAMAADEAEDTESGG